MPLPRLNLGLFFCAPHRYVRRAGGVEREASYPYASGKRGGQPSCRAVADDFVLGLQGEAATASAIARATRREGELAMALHVNSTGPLAVRESLFTRS